MTNSTATWKFIVSAVPFNVGNRFALDTLIKLGGTNVPYWNASIPCYPLPLPKSGVASTNNFTDMWSGFKADGDTILNYIFSNNIKNVFVLSGHTGTVGLDDGVNAGLPELMCANMKQANSLDVLDYQNFMGYSVWDLGGSGLCGQNNLNTTYGRVEIFNNDSIRLSAVDGTGTEVTGFNFYANAAYLYNPNYSANRLPVSYADTASMNENDTSVITVLANDVIFNNDSLYANLLTNPAHGNVIVNSNNTFTYIPDTGYFGVDTFRYTACNRVNANCQNCSNALVTISIAKVTTPTAITEIGDMQLKVYPNPADNILFAEVMNSTTAFDISLMNALGEELVRKSFAGKVSLDISKLAAGNYYYTLTNKVTHTGAKGKISIVR